MEKETWHTESGRLALSEHLQAHILEQVHDSVIATDLDGVVQSWNAAAERIYGYTAAEAAGRHIGFLYFPEDLAVLQQEVLAPLRSRGTHEVVLRHRRKTGEEIFVDLRLSWLRDETGAPVGMIGVSSDVTGRLKAEEEARRHKEFVDLVIQTSPHLIFVKDRDGNFLLVNQAMADSFRMSIEEMVNENNAALHGHAGEVEAYADVDRKVIRTGETRILEEPFTTREGEVRWYYTIKKPLVQPDGTVHVLGISTDITALKRAEEELKRYRDHLEELVARRTAELEARNQELDAFAHSVAHDLKSPLMGMLGSALLLEEEYAVMPAEQVYEFAQAIRRSGLKMNRIIDALLLLARVRETVVDCTPLDMAVVVAEALQQLDHLVEEARPEIVLPEVWPAALGHAPWVEAVWVNYLSNALKYGGRPCRVTLGAAAQDDGMVRFWVRDNGPGLTPREQARLFTPFTRLPDAGAVGHGLGLSIVRRIVTKLGGQVEVESDGVPGRGCVFSFTLPADRTPAEPA